MLCECLLRWFCVLMRLRTSGAEALELDEKKVLRGILVIQSLLNTASSQLLMQINVGCIAKTACAIW